MTFSLQGKAWCVLFVTSLTGGLGVVRYRTHMDSHCSMHAHPWRKSIQ